MGKTLREEDSLMFAEQDVLDMVLMLEGCDADQILG